MSVASGCGFQEVGVASGWVKSMSVVSRRWMAYMGEASECGCKEVHRFPHNYYLFLLLLFCSFLQQHPNFLFILF